MFGRVVGLATLSMFACAPGNTNNRFAVRDTSVPSVDALMPMDVRAVDVPAVTDTFDAAPAPSCPAACPAFSACDLETGACVCDAGFRMVAGACVEEGAVPQDLSTRTSDEVCRQWRNGRRIGYRNAWAAEPGNVCGLGSVEASARRDTLSTLNVYRWLTGLALVTEDSARSMADQGCALLMYRNNMASNAPPATWTCYTQAAVSAAQSANVIVGARSPRTAVDDWIRDTGSATVTNRRWFLNARLNSVGIGLAGENSFGACVGVQATQASPARTWSAWPAPGPMPIEAVPARWSLHSHSNTITLAQATVTLTRNGQTIAAMNPQVAPSSGAPEALVFTPAVSPVAGDSFAVSIQGISGGAPTSLSYTVNFVSCL